MAATDGWRDKSLMNAGDFESEPSRSRSPNGYLDPGLTGMIVSL
jgi:hypothetical protein